MDGRNRGTKCAAHYILDLPPGEEAVIRTRFFTKDEDPSGTYFGKEAFDDVFKLRKQETDEFYSTVGIDEFPFYFLSWLSFCRLHAFLPLM